MAKKETNITLISVQQDNAELVNNDAQVIHIEPLIRIVRDQQVLLDSDLAMLYGVEVKRLNEQVKRNIERFPEDFMFQLTKEEYELLKSQILTSNFAPTSLRSQIATLNEQDTNLKSQIATSSWGGVRKLPYAFTENGIAMLSSVLRSPTAIEVNIRIMRAFTAMRKVIATTMQVMQRLTKVEYEQIETNKRLDQVFSLIEKTDDKPRRDYFITERFLMHILLCVQ